MAWDVLTSLDEELRRIGREPHLDSLAMSLFHHLENGALVEIGFGEDHLVGPHLLENDRKLCMRAEAANAGHGLGSNGADELVAETASSRSQRLP